MIHNTKINTRNSEETLKIDIRKFAINVNLVFELGYDSQGILQIRII